MSKFRPFDYLTEEEKNEVLKYEALLQATNTVKEFIEIERILNDYENLGIARKHLRDLKRELKSIGALDEDEESSSHQVC